MELNNNNRNDDDINRAREYVTADYKSAECRHNYKYSHTKYIYDNQKEDALNILNIFYGSDVRAVSVQKKTKVGADGLMIELFVGFSTHPDNSFVIDPKNGRVLSGMSNKSWQDDMKAKMPTCFADIIFHHGKLSKSELSNISNALIIIDEIDSGDKETQRLHSTLKEAGILDVNHMINNNNRFIFISATMFKEFYDLYQWGDLHQLYSLTIPPNYIGHIEFLEKGIIKEFYSMKTKDGAERWIQEDILDNYGEEYRVHIARVTNKTANVLQDACIMKGVLFLNHTSDTRLSYDELETVFEKTITKHVVIAVKGFYRRANLIPNEWKKRIGAIHEFCTTGKVDMNVQVQGLPGRMTGYWRDDIIDYGHKTGPYRTSIKAVNQYEQLYNDPFGTNSCNSMGFSKRNGKVTVKTSTFLSPHNIDNMEPINMPTIDDQLGTSFNVGYEIIYNLDKLEERCNELGYNYKPQDKNKDNCGFYKTSLNKKSEKISLKQAIDAKDSSYGHGKNKEKVWRTFLPCYEDLNDKKSLVYLLIIKP
jgi:hypothetical protein